MKDTRLLVRHPAPFQTESLYGYILRISEQNGYRSPWGVFALAGMPQSETRHPGLRVTEIARITRRPIAQLTSISYYDPDSTRRCRLLGHNLLPRDLQLTQPRICPLCVDAKGIIEAHWDLDLMTGCPIHARSALTSCPGCSSPLRWSRPGLLECRCGAKLVDPGLPALAAPEADLLNVIYRKLLRLPIPDSCPSGLPSADLARMKMLALLSLIRLLGKNQSRLAMTQQSSPGSILSNAANLLSHWPENLFAFLSAIESNAPRARVGLARGSLSNFYMALFRSQTIEPEEHVEFVRRAIVQFRATRWGCGIADPKLLKRVGGESETRYITQVELARRLHVSKATAGRLLRAGTIASITVRLGNIDRKVVDVSKVKLVPVGTEEILRAEAAAAIIGISAKLLRFLRNSGTYQATDIVSRKLGFHALDVRKFVTRLRSLVGSETSQAQDPHLCISLQAALSKCARSVVWQADLVRKLLFRDIPVVGIAGSAPTDLLLSSEDFDKFVEEELRTAFGDTVSQHCAAQQLHCERISVSSLVQDGLLEAHRTPVGWRITVRSLTLFRKEFVSLAGLAAQLGTDARTLLARCRARNVEIVVARSNTRRQPFIRTTDADISSSLFVDADQQTSHKEEPLSNCRDQQPCHAQDWKFAERLP